MGHRRKTPRVLPKPVAVEPRLAEEGRVSGIRDERPQIERRHPRHVGRRILEFPGPGIEVANADAAAMNGWRK